MTHTKSTIQIGTSNAVIFLGLKVATRSALDSNRKSGVFTVCMPNPTMHEIARTAQLTSDQSTCSMVSVLINSYQATKHIWENSGARENEQSTLQSGRALPTTLNLCEGVQRRGTNLSIILN